MALTYDGTAGITFNDGSQLNTASQIGMRNKIINGNMVIAQRATSNSSIGNSNYNCLDRWILDTRINASPTGSYTYSQSSDAPAGFANSALITVTTAGNALANNYAMQFCHFIEGYNIADLSWGTSGAKAITLSFWVKSSLTGTWGLGILNAGYDRSYVATYTINSANTWQYVTINIPGCTTGTWNTTTGRGIQIKFSLGSGSNYVTNTPNTWLSGAEYEDVAINNFYATNGATWQITGVQLEKGSAATPFEYRHYGTELALCQRYYFQLGGSTGQRLGIGWWYNTTSALGHMIYFPVNMRSPSSISLSYSSLSDFYVYTTTTSITPTSIAIATADVNCVSIDLAVASGGTAGQASGFVAQTTSCRLKFSNEI